MWPWLYRGESLDNLDARSTWHSSWTPRSNAYIPNNNPPPSAFSGSAMIYGGGSGVQRPSLLSSYSVGHLRSGAGRPSSHSSQQSPLHSPLSPTRSPKARNNAGDPLQQSRYNPNMLLCLTPLTSCLSPLSGVQTVIVVFWCCKSRNSNYMKNFSSQVNGFFPGSSIT